MLERSSMTRLNKAFTLIELLVVIAIIAILAAILFPVFAKAREAARASSCRSNMKQLGTGMYMYVQDYDETYPGRSQLAGHWGYAVQPYIKNFQVFSCPSNAANTANATGGPDPAGSGQFLRRSYGMNAWIYDGKAMASIDAPADRILFGEQKCAHNDFVGNAWTGTGNYNSCGFAGHSGQMNLCYGDGHVKSKKPTQTVSSKLEWVNNVNTALPADCGGQATQCTDLIAGMAIIQNNYP